MRQETYSIDDLEGVVLEFQYESPRRIADALKSMGIKMYHRGAEANLENWYPSTDREPDPKAPKVVVRGARWDPDPALVLVTRDSLPEAWLSQLEIEEPDEEVWDGAFDPDDPRYPVELDLAVTAWRAVSRQEVQGLVKQAIRSWIEVHCKSYNLSDEAIERICTVCNWEKRGGRKATGRAS